MNKLTELSTGEAKREINVQIYNQEVKEYVKNKGILKRNIQKTYGLIWGQCSEALKELVRHLEDYKDKSREFDVILLLEEL